MPVNRLVSIVCFVYFLCVAPLSVASISTASISAASLSDAEPKVASGDEAELQTIDPVVTSPVAAQDAEVSSSSQPSGQPSDYVQRLVGPQAGDATTHSPNSTTQLAITVAGLFAVIGMIFVVAWGVRRLSGGQFGHRNAVIKILATQPLGTKERICLIDVGGQQVLVGITAQSMQTLMVLDQPIDLKSEKQSSAWSSAESVNSVFGAKLQSLLKGTPSHEVKRSNVDD
jgi:flagellar protein FliO/FliZ